MCFLLLFIFPISAQDDPENFKLVRVDLVAQTGTVRNFGDVTSMAYPAGRWCNFPNYPSFNIPVQSPHSMQTFALGAINIDPLDFELGVYRSTGFNNPANIRSYITVGMTNTRTNVAVTAGVWSNGLDFVPAGGAISIYRFIGNPEDQGSSFWRVDGINPTAKIIWDDFSVTNNVAVGDVESIFIPVVNLGNGSLTISAINFSGMNPEDYTLALGVSLPIMVPVDGSTMVEIIYSPQDKGLREASMDFTSDTFAGPNSVALGPVTAICSTTTYSNLGGWSNGSPTPSANAIISGTYTTSDLGSGSLNVCTCQVESSGSLTITDGDFLRVEGNINVDGILTVEHQGSVVQTNGGITTNSGSIVVQKTTPNLEFQDFMIMGSPMSAETREGVYGSGKRVLNHITGNFVPNPDVELIAPGTANWADDNGDNWAIHTGAILPGEGYLVKPQSDAIPSGSYSLDYTLGTLNSGIINFTIDFNTTQNDSPNIMGNPYASAIDADIFVGSNTMINEVYFWEHLTAPISTYPGYQANNFDMGDISVYVPGSGGTAAANGGDIPEQWIASGQGFGIKTTALGTAEFNNSMRVTGPNTSYRSLEQRDRMWLDLKNQTYNLGSNMLIVFAENATDSFDQNYDSRRLATPVSLYSILDRGEELVIQGRTSFNEDQEVPLGFSTMIEETQDYTISIRQTEGALIENSSVYLMDHLLNTWVDLSTENYSFTSNEGTYSDRFVIVFQEPSVLGILDSTLEFITVTPNPTQGRIVVSSPKIIIERVHILDVQGRRITSIENISESLLDIDTTPFASGIFFVRVYTSEGSITKKIVKK